ncbi:lantibiotic dehydratase family protein [Sphingobacterium sp. KU25419]|nr:lantibiotic dehydratase family protein [Sphingobacterium sp. KU25419]
MLKYTIRMGTRCTPFGYFAGISFGEIKKNDDTLFLRSHVDKIVFKLDMSILLAMVESILKDPIITRNLYYKINPTIYLDGNCYKYYQQISTEKENQNILKSVRCTVILDRIFLYLREIDGKATMEMLHSFLKEAGASEEQSISFIQNLIKQGIIFSELYPNVTGENYFNRVISILKRVDIENNYLPTFLDISNKMKNNKSVSYINNSILEKLKNELPNKDFNKLIQGDLLIGMEKNIISRTIIKKLEKQFQKLLVLDSTNSISDLEKFKVAFLSKYNDRVIPLITALDLELGIGYGNNQSSYTITDEILKDIKFKISKSQIEKKPHYYQSVVTEKYIESVKNKSTSICLTDEDIEIISKLKQTKSEPIPASFYAIGNMLFDSTKAGCIVFNLSNIGGSSSGNLLTRFAHLDEKLELSLKKSALKEQELYGDIQLAEISYVSDPKVGNLLQRPDIRNISICLTPLCEDNQKYVDINDLYIFSKDGELFLWSKKFNQIIQPRLTTAHDFSYSMNVYRFLADFQFQKQRLNIAWDWGILKNEPHLPRVTYKILSYLENNGKLLKSQRSQNLNKKKMSL